jgi:HEAT repeat protein
MKLKHIKLDLQSDKPRVVHEAVRSLGRVESEETKEALDILGPLLSHGNSMLRYASLLSILELKGADTYWEQIKTMIEDGDPKVREAVVITLAQVTKPGSDEFLLDLLDSPHPEIRYQVPISIVEKGVKECGPRLVKLLESEKDVEIVVNIITALGDLKYREAIDLLMVKAKEDQYELIRFEAACAVGRMGDKKASEYLANFASHFEYGFYACTVLDQLNDPSITEKLNKLYNKLFLRSKYKLPIAASLARLGDDSGKSLLIKKTKSFSMDTRILAFERLGYTNAKWAIAPLVMGLNKKDLHEREIAFESLTQLSFPETIKHIKEFKIKLEKEIPIDQDLLKRVTSTLELNSNEEHD